MNSKQKGWLLVGPVIFSFAMAMTTPVVHVYFMRLIDASVLAVRTLVVLIAGESGINLN